MKKKIGVIGVDAGICWIGDPCYIHQDGKEKMPKEWGKNWSEFCYILMNKESADRGPNNLAQFNYDIGHPGLGVCVSTGYGDGCYNVYADIIENETWGKRVKSVTVVFIEDEKKSARLMKRIASKKMK